MSKKSETPTEFERKFYTFDGQGVMLRFLAHNLLGALTGVIITGVTAALYTKEANNIDHGFDYFSGHVVPAAALGFAAGVAVPALSMGYDLLKGRINKDSISLSSLHRDSITAEDVAEQKQHFRNLALPAIFLSAVVSGGLNYHFYQSQVQTDQMYQHPTVLQYQDNFTKPKETLPQTHHLAL